MVYYSLIKILYKKIKTFTLKYNKIKLFVLITLITLFILFYNPSAQIDFHNNEKLPTVLIVVSLICNKSYILPYFFSCLENLDYSKSRLSLLLQSDYNEDNSIELINLWVNRTSNEYNYVELQFQNATKDYRNETLPNDWTKERISHVIQLREKALQIGQKLLADFIFFLDADVLLTNCDTLKLLTSFKLPIISPMLLSDDVDPIFLSNKVEYKPIFKLEKIGNFQVHMVHSAVLINLNPKISKYLTFDLQRVSLNRELNRVLNRQLMKNGTSQLHNLKRLDIVTFKMSADSFGIPMALSNVIKYGYKLKRIEGNAEIHEDYEELLNIKLDVINNFGTGIKINKDFQEYLMYPARSKLSLDHIYIINLERRLERKNKLEFIFKELGLDVEYFPAIDGKTLNLYKIEKMGIHFLHAYKDPFYNRRLSMGEVGCFLSHYKIWQKIIKLDQREVLILEDDIRFVNSFCKRAIDMLNQARKVGNWDLLYFGRNPVQFNKETWVKGTTNLRHAKYSQAAYAYVITLKAAKKLVDIKPLEKLLPTDELLPIMYNQSPNYAWSKPFKTRNLLAYGVEPSLIHPAYYPCDNGHTSDTEVIIGHCTGTK